MAKLEPPSRFCFPPCFTRPLGTRRGGRGDNGPRYRQREVEETNRRLEAMFLDMMQKEEQRQREVEEWLLG